MTLKIGTQKDILVNYKRNICPKIKKVLEKTMTTIGECGPTWINDGSFSIFGV